MKTVIDDLDIENISTVELMNLLSGRNHKLGTEIEGKLTSEFWRRYPFYLFMDLAKKIDNLTANQEEIITAIDEIKQVVGAMTQILIDKGIIPSD